MLESYKNYKNTINYHNHWLKTDKNETFCINEKIIKCICINLNINPKNIVQGYNDIS